MFRFHDQDGSKDATTAALVYEWLLCAKVPLEFEIGNVFWDAVKRFLFTPCCLLYGAVPVVAAWWAARTCGSLPLAHEMLLSALLIIPNIVTAFMFQSFMISVAAVMRRKLLAMKALTHMLSPVCLYHPAAWLLACMLMGVNQRAAPRARDDSVSTARHPQHSHSVHVSEPHDFRHCGRAPQTAGDERFDPHAQPCLSFPPCCVIVGLHAHGCELQCCPLPMRCFCAIAKNPFSVSAAHHPQHRHGLHVSELHDFRRNGHAAQIACNESIDTHAQPRVSLALGCVIAGFVDHGCEVQINRAGRL